MYGKPGVVFTASNSQRLSFTPTGFPTGTSPVSGLVAAFGNGAQNGGEAIAFGTPAVNQVFRIITSASSVAQYTNAGLTLSGTTWTNVDSTTVATIAGGTSPTANLYQNGVFAASGTAPTQNLSNFEGKIGSIEDGSSGYWNGTIQQIVIGNVAFSTCQRQKLEGWESWYDGKAGANLPSDHPYKNTPPVVDGTC